MSRIAILKSAVMFALAAFLLSQVSCVKLNPSNTPQPLGVSTYPTVAAAGESDTVWWDAVAGATSYNLYYTSDGYDPTTSSASIPVSASYTGYVHTGLDPTLIYTYAVQAVGHGRVGDLSEASYGVQPLPMIHATFTFNDYAYDNVGFMYFQVDGNYKPINSTKKFLAGSTDAYGSALFNATIDHDNNWGYSVFEDMDDNGLLSTGDTIWGNNTNPGFYGYIYWSSLVTSSKTFTISFDANSTFDSLPHVY
jgi:hypothetical protein